MGKAVADRSLFTKSLLFALFFLFAAPLQAESLEPLHLVTRVIDGDTLELDGKKRVRLIGVDTPESVHPSKPVEAFGKEASAFTRRLAEKKKVRLEYGNEARDRYGRTLAYVYLPDGTLLNAEIIKQGFAHAYTRFPFKYLDEFRRYEREAREAGRGLWAVPSSRRSQASSDLVSFNQRSHKIHKLSCRALKTCTNCIQVPKSEALGRGGNPCGICGG